MYADPAQFTFSLKKNVITNLLMTALIVLFGNIGLLLSYLGVEHSYWSPQGIALAGILLFGFQLIIPSLLLGFFILTLQQGLTPFSSIGVYISNIIEPVLGGMLLFTYGRSKFRLKNLKDVFTFMMFAVLLAPFIFSTLKVALLFKDGGILSSDLSATWAKLFTRDVLSILLLTPLSVGLFNKKETKLSRFEALGLFGLLVLLTCWSMSGSSNRIFSLLPVVIWISIRFSFRGASIASLIIGAIAICRSSHLFGFYAGNTFERDILWIQCLTGGSCLVGYFLATTREANEEARARQLESNINLQDKRIAEEALAILDQSIQKSPIGFSLIDKKFQFIHINEMMAELNGVPAKSHLGRTIYEIMPEIAPEIEVQISQVFQTGKSVINIPIQGRSKTKPFDMISGLQSFYPVRHPNTNEIFGVATSFQDMTEQKNAERKLKLTEADLLHALSVRDEFVAIASHELKTPLTSLRLQTELFQRGMAKDGGQYLTEEKVHVLLDRNAKQIDRLTRLVDDMLDISRLKTGHLSIKKDICDLNQILRDILHRTKEQFEASGSGLPDVVYTQESKGDWDCLRIEQVVTNIITNAIRYGRGKTISIIVQNVQESVRLSVKDQGLGIARSDQKKIFQRYERGLLAREISGLGLGLFITEQIVTAHGGRIWVESELNQGSTFNVELPLMVMPALFHLGQEFVPAGEY